MTKHHAEPNIDNFIKKESLAQVFSCELCKIPKNSFFYRTPLVAASGCCNSIFCSVLIKFYHCQDYHFTELNFYFMMTSCSF